MVRVCIDDSRSERRFGLRTSARCTPLRLRTDEAYEYEVRLRLSSDRCRGRLIRSFRRRAPRARARAARRPYDRRYRISSGYGGRESLSSGVRERLRGSRGGDDRRSYLPREIGERDDLVGDLTSPRRAVSIRRWTRGDAPLLLVESNSDTRRSHRTREE